MILRKEGWGQLGSFPWDCDTWAHVESSLAGEGSTPFASQAHSPDSSIPGRCSALPFWFVSFAIGICSFMYHLSSLRIQRPGEQLASVLLTSVVPAPRMWEVFNKHLLINWLNEWSILKISNSHTSPFPLVFLPFLKIMVSLSVTSSVLDPGVTVMRVCFWAL